MDVTTLLNEYHFRAGLNVRQVAYIGEQNALRATAPHSESTLDILHYLHQKDGIVWDHEHPAAFVADFVTSGQFLPGARLRPSLSEEDKTLFPTICKNVLGNHIGIHAITDKIGKKLFIPTYDESESHLFYISDNGEARRLDKAVAKNGGFSIESESETILLEMKKSSPAKVKGETIKRITTFILGEVAPAIRHHKAKELLNKTLNTLPQIPTPKGVSPAIKI